MKKKDYYTINELCDLYRISRTTFWRMRQVHDLPCAGFKRGRIYARKDLDRWWEQFYHDVKL